MKKILVTLLVLISQCCLTVPAIMAQGMSDQQVIQFIASEAKAGTSQAQIVTKLIQRGVKMDQIRRLRNQYESQISKRGMSAAADGAVQMAANRMAANTDGTTSQELNTAKVGTSGTIESDASADVQAVENDVQATQGTAPDVNGKQVYGRDIFRQANPNFQPNPNMPIPENYVLGPGDQVVVDIYGASQNTIIHTISPEGTITVAGYGPIYLSGLSVAGAQSKLRSTLGSRYKSSDLRVTVGNTRTIQVNIMGEVRSPGTYQLSAFANVFYALYRAGGTSDLGTLRNIKVYRNGKLVTVVDLYQYILNGRLAGNIRLQDNDVIQVEPYEALVGITGNIKRPMFYEMRKNESLATLIRYAGGFSGDAHKKSVRLVRQSGEHYQVFNVNEFDIANFKVMDGDAVTVDGILNRFDNMVEIKGAVFRPGQFHLGDNVTSVRSLVQAAEGLTEDAYTGRAILHRLKADRSLETLPIDLAGIIDGTVADIPLRNEDVLFIMTQENLRQERTFTITGEVMSPGTYEYADNTTIQDLIVMAGGLRDQASLAKVDVSRRILDPYSTQKSDTIAKFFTFELKDGLVMTNQQGFVLEPYDVVHVYRSPAFATARNITVRGEVNYEGNFTLQNKKMRLSDAVKIAGGLTNAAYLRGARLIRQMNEEERLRAQSTIKALRNILTERGDSINMNNLAIAENTYLVGIQLDEAIKNPGSDKDVVLREGDQLYIPEYNGVVKVSGDVFYPNNIFYEKKKSAKYYIHQAGGYGNNAKKSKTFIVYQNGTIGVASKGAKPEPGCEIIVPSKQRRTFDLAGFTSIGTSLASLATLIIALTKL
ncbi:MAG: SLBB domain-containing protein [Prevotella sp.]|nr:SLBB domain-containing protein [Prevotella sp.]